MLSTVGRTLREPCNEDIFECYVIVFPPGDLILCEGGDG